jgi:hypothetical protein
MLIQVLYLTTGALLLWKGKTMREFRTWFNHTVPRKIREPMQGKSGKNFTAAFPLRFRGCEDFTRRILLFQRRKPQRKVNIGSRHAKTHAIPE